MPPLPRFALFVAATLALTLTPGPAVLFIVARSAGQGRRAGLLSVAGIGLGNSVHAVVVALGLASLLASSPVAFALVRWLGAGDLAWLGVRRLLARDRPEGGADPQAAAPAGPGVVREAFWVAVLNPKTALFFLAFLPQFADPARGALPAQLLLLGLVFTLTAVLTDTGYALLAGTVGARLRRSPGAGRWARFVTAAVYLGLAAVAALGGRVPA